MVFTRPAALLREQFGPARWPIAEDAPVDQDELPDLMDNFRPLVEDVLFAQGWRLDHSAVRGVMRGPDGERVDAADLVAGPIADPDLTAFANLVSPVRGEAEGDHDSDRPLVDHGGDDPPTRHQGA
jgi:hypothetical protein